MAWHRFGDRLAPSAHPIRLAKPVPDPPDADRGGFFIDTGASDGSRAVGRCKPRLERRKSNGLQQYFIISKIYGGLAQWTEPPACTRQISVRSRYPPPICGCSSKVEPRGANAKGRFRLPPAAPISAGRTGFRSASYAGSREFDSHLRNQDPRAEVSRRVSKTRPCGRATYRGCQFDRRPKRAAAGCNPA